MAARPHRHCNRREGDGNARAKARSAKARRTACRLSDEPDSRHDELFLLPVSSSLTAVKDAKRSRQIDLSPSLEGPRGPAMPPIEQSASSERVPMMQRILDNPFLLLFLGVTLPTVLYLIWGIMEVASIPLAK
jgi:hypothetical protein